MSRLATEPATRLAVLLVFVIFCLRLPLLLVPLFSSSLCPLSSSHSPLTLLCCSPVYVRHIKLSIYCCKSVARCFLLLALPLAFLQTTPSHTHTYTRTHTHARRQQSALVCIARSRFVGFVIIVGSSLGAMPTRQQAFQLAIWLWRWLCHCPKGMGSCRAWQGGVALSLRGG